MPKISCPACHTTLKLKDNRSVGKKATCPRCREVFVVELPEADGDEFDFGNDPGEAAEETVPASPKHPGAGNKGAGKSASRSPASRRKLLLIAGGLTTALLAGVLWALGVFSSKEPTLKIAASPASPAPAAPVPATSSPAAPAAAAAPTATSVAAAAPQRLALEYLPADSELLIVVRLADLWKAPLVQSMVNAPQVTQALATMRERVGLTPSDFESLTIGITGISKAVAEQPEMPRAPGQALSALSQLSGVGVVRLKKPVDAATLKLAEHGGKAAQHQDKSYFTGGVDEEGGAIYLASPTTLVVGPEDSIKQAIERGDKPSARSELQFVEADHHLVLVFAPSDLAGLRKKLPAAGGFTEDQEINNLLSTRLKAASLGLDITRGAAVHVGLDCDDSAAAGKIGQSITKSLAQANQQPAARLQNPNDPPSLGAQFMKSLSVSANGTTVRIAGGLPDSAEQQLAQLPQQLMGLFMMAQMMAGGPNNQNPFGNPQFGREPGAPGGFPAQTDPFGPADALPPTGAAVPARSFGTNQRQSGEGPAQKSRITQGLPEGVQVVGRALWKPDLMPDPQGKTKPSALVIEVEVAGGAAAQTTQYGMYKITKSVADGKAQLKYQEAPWGEQPSKQFVRRQNIPEISPQPDDGVRARFNFGSPGRIQKISEFAGSLALRIPKSPSQVKIANIASRLDQAVDQPEFTKAGLALRVVKDGPFMALSVTKGDASLIGDVVPTDGSGTPLEGMRLNPTTGMRNDEPQFQWFPREDLPKDMGLAVTLFSGTTEIPIPFQFVDLVVPSSGQTGAAESSDSGGSTTSSAKEPAVAASAFAREFEKNASVAERKYRGKSITVEGKAATVAPSTVYLEGVPGLRVMCVLRATTDKVKYGDTVIIQGKYKDRGAIAVTLSDCEVVAVNP